MSSGDGVGERGARSSPQDGHRYAERSDEIRSVVVLQVATLGGFKLATSIMILYFFPSWHALLVILGLSVPWIIAGAWYGGWYSRVRLRLVRARAKRHRLLYEEWHID